MRIWIGLLLIAMAVSGAHAQVIDRHIDSTHHEDSEPVIHATDWLNDRPDIRESYDRYLQWHREGRAGFQPMGPEAARVQFPIGTVRTFKVYNFNREQTDDVQFTLRAVGDYSRIWVANDQWGAGKITEAVVASIKEIVEERTPANSIDPGRGIIPIETEIFGNIPDVDGSGLVNILLTDIKDAWTPDSGEGFVAGFVYHPDLNRDDSRGNGMDILYIDTFPGMYREDRPANAERAFNTIAHELQHLINARYGRMPTFQDEGQSEWAELLTGFSGRSITYLNTASEVNAYLYQWRSFTNDVLRDYQRAGLFHTYMAGRIGAEAMGSLTRQSTARREAYEAVLEPADITWEDVLAEFHAANWINNRAVDARFGYTAPQRQGVRATSPALQYAGSETQATSTRTLSYGGGEYVQWLGVTDLALNLTADSGMRFFAIKRAFEQPGLQVVALSQGSHTFAGEFESIVLATVNVRAQGGNELNPQTRSYTYNAEWEALPVVQEQLSYAGQAAFFAELPGTQTEVSRQGINAFSVRFSPSTSGRLEQVSFALNSRQDSSLVGTGDLYVILTESRDAGGQGPTRVLEPGAAIDSVAIPISQLSFGTNTVDLQERNWDVTAEEDFHIVFRIHDRSANARIEFLLDAGQSNQNDADYWPARTRVFIGPPSRAEAGWYRYTDNNNLLVSTGIVGFYAGPMVEPVITRQPESVVVAEGARLELTVEATGQPAVQYQWRRNGENIPGATSRTYTVDNVQRGDEGMYTVRVSNLAGATESDAADVRVEAGVFGISESYPNPVRTQGTFQYFVDDSQRIVVALYDMMGRRVLILAERRQQPGLHTVTWNVDDLASGVYFLRITGEHGQDGRKVVIAR